MKLYRLRLCPRSAWRTPWQADTLVGALCATCARVRGAEFLRERVIAPMLAGNPPFVLSDAFPGDFLPAPLAVRLAPPPPDADRKAVKRGRWLARDDFLTLRDRGTSAGIPWDRLWPDAAVFCDDLTRHNTLARDSDVSLEGAGPFARLDTRLRNAPGGRNGLTLYVRVGDEQSADLLLELLHELSLVGFGADVATGRGQFEIAADPEAADDLDQSPADAHAVAILSTFQPAPGDPIDGVWEAFPKFGKVGPDLGLSDVRKHTLIMFRPGACFRARPGVPYLGRALPMTQFLPENVVSSLHERGIEVIHPAYGLAIPLKQHLPDGD